MICMTPFNVILIPRNRHLRCLRGCRDMTEFACKTLHNRSEAATSADPVLRYLAQYMQLGDAARAFVSPANL